MSEIRIAAAGDLADGDYRVLDLGAIEIGLFRQGGKFFAYENKCPHYGGPVCQGKIFNRVEEVLAPDRTSRGLRFSSERHIVCPWHGYEFSIATGRHPGDPQVRLKPVPVSLRDDAIYLRLPD